MHATEKPADQAEQHSWAAAATTSIGNAFVAEEEDSQTLSEYEIAVTHHWSFTALFNSADRLAEREYALSKWAQSIFKVVRLWTIKKKLSISRTLIELLSSLVYFLSVFFYLNSECLFESENI